MSIAVLSIDGGGIKGIVSAVVLDKLEQLLKEYSNFPDARIGDYFDLIAGTSTGSILTALYLFPENGHPKYSANEILHFYLELGSNIFQKRPLYPLFGSKYTESGLKDTLDYFFDDLKISELLKPCLFTAYDTTSRKAEFFNQITGKKDPLRNPLVSEAVRASCSAPTYFPPVCLSIPPDCPSCYVDGGVIANNPSLCALIEALKLEECNSIQEIHLLSIGNANNDSSYYYENVKKWGLIEWAVPLFSILLNSNTQTVDYQLQTLFHIIGTPEHYLRLQTNTPTKPPALDDYDNATLDYLLNAGDKLIKKYEKELNQFAHWLVTRK